MTTSEKLNQIESWRINELTRINAQLKFDLAQIDSENKDG